MATRMKLGLDAPAIKRLAGALCCVDGNFSSQPFIRKAKAGVKPLELRQRVDFMIDLLARQLPGDFELAANLLQDIPDHWDHGDPDDPLRGFAAWPIIDYVGVHGLNHPQRGLDLLKRLTPLFTAEFAIRAFLIQHTDFTLKVLEGWCKHPDEHVRRLVSEGTRPRLPWGKRLHDFVKDPSPTLALLEQLKDDPSETVRRSVANHLNDIAKDHPQTVLDVCKNWQTNASEQRQWIIRHATRTLVKQGFPGVYSLLGFTDQPEVKISKLKLSNNSIRIGESLDFGFLLTSLSSSRQSMVVDYAIHHLKANGRTSPKVFKFKNIHLASGEASPMNKTHRIRPISTRKYYPGRHFIEILVNGKPLARKAFELKTNSMDS